MAIEKDGYSVTPRARAEAKAEIDSLRGADPKAAGQYWERYHLLAERVFFQGLEGDDLVKLGFQLREGASMRDLNIALNRGLIGVPKTFEADQGRVSVEFQRLLAITDTSQHDKMEDL